MRSRWSLTDTSSLSMPNVLYQPSFICKEPLRNPRHFFPELHVYLTVEPPATVQLSLCSAGFMMSWTIFSSLCLSVRVDTWLVRPANESDCTRTDCGSHVKRVLTRRFFLSCQRVFRTLTTMLVAGFLNEARQPGTRADFSVRLRRVH